MDKKRDKDGSVDFFIACVLKLKDAAEARSFFEDVCTVQELRAIGQRLSVAHMLGEGWVYSDIVDSTGASTATVSRVSRSFNYGNGGYQTVFPRLSGDERSLLPSKEKS